MLSVVESESIILKTRNNLDEIHTTLSGKAYDTNTTVACILAFFLIYQPFSRLLCRIVNLSPDKKIPYDSPPIIYEEVGDVFTQS